ncbi:ImuA family protein [Novosphingobium sp. BL-52-GroH]|uniref:ImuA family protein n=1 Tax=Novosphingobium sp. BL-52-GroH TaxID=3349877 RepID=UPI00384C0768
MFQSHAPPTTDPPTRTALPRLAKGQLHEVHAAADGWASALAFALATIEADPARPIMLLRVRKAKARTMRMEPCGEGWASLGLDPARLVIVDAPSDAALLRAGLDTARCPGPGAVVLEAWGPLREYDLVASRRLILAAEGSRLPIVVLRGDAEPRASAAHTRWAVSNAPSTPLAMRAPGPPALLVELQRRRGGPGGLTWRLEWNEEHGGFREEPIIRTEPPADAGTAAPLSGAVVSLAAVRTRAA